MHVPRVACVCRSLAVDLGRKVEANVAELLHLVLDHERHIGREAERDVAGERRRLGEEVEVAQCKRQRDRLFELDRHSLFVVDSALALAARDVAGAELALRKKVSDVNARESTTRILR